MKKIILTGAILSTFFAQAQQGIGTNTPDKSSVLDLQSSKRGLLIPRIELKATNNAAPVNTPANSLLVYNTAIDGAGDTKVTPGYYYWDGSKWVRMVDSGSQNAQEWKYNPTHERIELVRSGQPTGFNNHIFYDKNGGYKDLDFSIRRSSSEADLEISTDNFDFNYFTPYNVVTKKSSSIPTATNVSTGYEGKKYLKFLNYNFLNIDKTSLPTDQRYTVTSNNLIVKEDAVLTTPLSSIGSLSGFLEYYSPIKVNNIVGTSGFVLLGKMAKANYVTGGTFGVANESKDIESVEEQIKGINSTVHLRDGSHTAETVAVRTDSHVNETAEVKRVRGTNNFLSISGNVTEYAESTRDYFNITSTATVPELFGYRLSTSEIETGANITDFYGIYLGDVNKASNKNYSIYTNAGNVRIGDLAQSGATGDRVVGVDENGVLKITQLNAVGSKTINFDSGTHDLSTNSDYSNNLVSVVINATIDPSGNVEIKLPPAEAANLGQMISVRITNTIEPTGAQEVVIKNSANAVLSYGQLPYQSWIFKSDGTTWEKI